MKRKSIVKNLGDFSYPKMEQLLKKIQDSLHKLGYLWTGVVVVMDRLALLSPLPLRVCLPLASHVVRSNQERFHCYICNLYCKCIDIDYLLNKAIFGLKNNRRHAGHHHRLISDFLLTLIQTTKSLVFHMIKP